MSGQIVLPLPNPSDWLSIDDTAAELGVRRNAVYQMMADGRLRRYRIGAHTVLWRAEVAQLAAAIKVAGVAPCPTCKHRWRAHSADGARTCNGDFGHCPCGLSRATVAELNRKQAAHA